MRLINKTRYLGVVFMLIMNHGFAQQDSKNTCWGSEKKKVYDTSTLTQVKGTITEIKHPNCGKGQGKGVHLILKTEKTDTYEVHLGPLWYLEKQNILLSEGDTIVVSGSKVMLNKQEVIIAREFEKGSSTIILRDKNGIPLWSGRKNKA